MNFDTAIIECQKCAAEVSEYARLMEYGSFRYQKERHYPEEILTEIKIYIIENQKRAQALYESSAALYAFKYEEGWDVYLKV